MEDRLASRSQRHALSCFAVRSDSHLSSGTIAYLITASAVQSVAANHLFVDCMSESSLFVANHGLWLQNASTLASSTFDQRPLMACPHLTIRRCLLVTATFCLAAIGCHAIAGDTTMSPRPHSLIHRNAPDVIPADPETSTPPRRPATAPATRSPQRKLTRRPAQLPMAGASNDTVTSQATAVPSPSSLPMQKAGTESRVSTGVTGGLAPLGAPMSSTTATTGTGTGTASAMSSVSTASSPTKTPMASAVPGVGQGPTVSQAVAAGRGLQSLTTQMPGLTQLTAPTVVVSSPPPPNQSAPSSFPPATAPTPPSSSPPGTGTATLSWTLNTETGLAGYRIYVGTASGVYNYPGSPFAVGVTSSYTVTGLPSGQTYYFAISAFDFSGSESGLSAEVTKSIY